METAAPATARRIGLQAGDVLVVTDMQRDFITGSLAVPDAAAVIPVMNRYVRTFVRRELPIVATRDWHPAGHSSFRDRGGPWPPHCIAGTAGAAFVEGIALGPDVLVISKATTPEREAYSAFDGTELELRLHRLHAKRLFIGGLTTDYCVHDTTLDARRIGYEVFVLEDAIRAVNVKPGDGERAIAEMRAAGARTIRFEELDTAEALHG
ncbi:MAG TPA: isochorismatase family protein [Usitatibacter sp.]|nr:isochorismatase family protein [Usitatibacter sp.]